MSNLMQRILVAAIGIPIVLYVCFQRFSLLGLAVLFALLAVHEFYGLAKAKGFVPQIILGMLLTALIVMSFAQFLLLRAQTADLLPIILIAGVIITLTAEMFKGYPNPLVQISTTLAGALYLGVGLGGFFGVHEYFFLRANVLAHVSDASLNQADTIQTAAYFTIAMLASIWICDTAAFAAGRAMGKHKIAPTISPNKSWEGGIAGVIGAIVTWQVACAYLAPLHEISMSTSIAMGLIAGVFGQVGDFAESLLKRDAGVKDSSSLIPGHGGVLDRLDSILFVSPLAYVWLHVFGM